MHPHLPILMLITSLVFAPTVFAQQKLDIIQIMGQFVQANHAASKCIKPGQSTLSKFLGNFHLVTVRAAEEMKKRKPYLTDQQISEKFKTASDAVAKQIDDVIRVNGCSDLRIQDLLKRFEVQSASKIAWNLSADG